MPQLVPYCATASSRHTSVITRQLDLLSTTVEILQLQDQQRELRFEKKRLQDELHDKTKHENQLRFLSEYNIYATRPINREAALNVLSALQMAMLRSRGIEGAYRAVSGSMCDGAYNVVVANRKLAGTAQRWKGLGRNRPQEYAVLAHFAMFLNLDLSAAAEAINALYADMGVASDVQARTHINYLEIEQPRREDVLHAFTDELNAHCQRLRDAR